MWSNASMTSMTTPQIMTSLSADFLPQTEFIDQMPTDNVDTPFMPCPPSPMVSLGSRPMVFSYPMGLPHGFTDTSPPAETPDISPHSSSFMHVSPPCSCVPIQQEIYDLTTRTHALIVQAYGDLITCLNHGLAMPWQGYTAQFYRDELEVIIAHLRVYADAL